MSSSSSTNSILVATVAFAAGAAAAAIVLVAVLDQEQQGKITQSANQQSPATLPPPAAAPRRYGGAIRLQPDQYRRYRELHDAVWPAVLHRMAVSNIRNFSIYYHEETCTLFQCFEWIGHWNYYYQNEGTLPTKQEETALFDQDMQAIANDPITLPWWKECEPCQEPFSQWIPGSTPLSEGGSGNWWAPLECVTHCGYWPIAYSEEQSDPDFVTLDRK